MNTLSDAMESLIRQGFTEHFGVRGDQLRGFESGKTFGSQDVIIREYDRFEGVSDPDDMAILYALESSSGSMGPLSTPSACIRIRQSAHFCTMFDSPTWATYIDPIMRTAALERRGPSLTSEEMAPDEAGPRDGHLSGTIYPTRSCLDSTTAAACLEGWGRRARPSCGLGDRGLRAAVQQVLLRDPPALGGHSPLDSCYTFHAFPRACRSGATGAHPDGVWLERGRTCKARRAPRSQSMGFLHLPTTGFLYLILTALLLISTGLLGFASAH
jgi:hypothetical protein